MAERKLFSTAPETDEDGAPTDATQGGTRAETMQRLQIGAGGILAMVLVMGVASVISNRAAVTDGAAVPDAAPTTEPTETAAPSDPLAEAGVVPMVPADGEEAEAGEKEEDAPTVPDIELEEDRNAPDRN